MSYVEMGMTTKAMSILEDPVIVAIAAKHGKTTAQVSLRWAVQHGISVIPKTGNVGRMAENKSVFDFALDEAEMKEIDGLEKNKRYNNPAYYEDKNCKINYPIFD